MIKLSVHVQRTDDRVVVKLSGELDMAEISRVRQELDDIEASKPPEIVFDLRDLSFIDSSGLRLVLETDVRARKEARRLMVVPGPEPVHRIFLIALLDKRLDFIDPAEADGGAPSGGAAAGGADDGEPST